jgi:hypothetical protein
MVAGIFIAIAQKKDAIIRSGAAKIQVEKLAKDVGFNVFG